MSSLYHRFYNTFVIWNTNQVCTEKSYVYVKLTLREIKRYVDWDGSETLP
jgi:hypothetical protein